MAVHRSTRDNFLLQLKLGDMALRDVLTGLRNRRYLEEFLEAEIPRMVRSWHPNSIAKGNAFRNLGIIMLDLDHFKTVNDTHGHAAGDEVLKQVARLLQETTRKPDLVVRWGGEEFVILILDAHRTLPMVAAERIRAAFEKHSFRLPSGEVLQKTCSLGYAHFPFLPELPDRLDWEQVLNLADGALYQAKLAGRNHALGVIPGDTPPQRIAEALQDVDEGLHKAITSGILRLTK
jgi:diguanylate cyclase (GGDEF)-like protein